MKKIFPFFCALSLLTGCSNNFVLTYKEYVPSIRSESFLIDHETDAYYQRKEINPIEVYDTSLNKIQIKSTYDIRKVNASLSHTLLENKEEAKILVIPVAFKDSDTSIDRETKTTYIKNAFFGSEEVTQNDSVASFYNKSSYNQLKITGEVTPWFNLDIYSYEWKLYDSTYNSASRKIVAECFAKLVEQNYDLSHFGNNIKGIYCIYDYPYTKEFKGTEQDNFFWAYCDYFTHSAPAPYVTSGYCWSSFEFIYNQGGKPDASTLIHEVGHLFGLEDYYNIEANQNNHYHPTGFFDTMDSNQGDHNSFSKYLLDWYSPKVIKPGFAGEITLKDFSVTGDSLILPINNNYQDNPFGEYLILEYFVPNGLNNGDGYRYVYKDVNGEKHVFEYPSHHGLKVYYVDARLAYFSTKKVSSGNYEFICMVDDPDALNKLKKYNNFFVDYYNNNSVKDSEVADFNEEISGGKKRPLISLLESSGSNSFKQGYFASNDTLFKYGSEIGYTNYIGLSKKINYKINVIDILTKEAKINLIPLNN